MQPDMRDAFKLVSMLRKNKNTPQEIMVFIRGLYMQGYADGYQDTEGEEIFLRVTNQRFECECPNCHEMLELYLKEIAKEG